MPFRSRALTADEPHGYIPVALLAQLLAADDGPSAAPGTALSTALSTTHGGTRHSGPSAPHAAPQHSAPGTR